MRKLIVAGSYSKYLKRCRELKEMPRNCVYVDCFARISGMVITEDNYCVESDARSLPEFPKIMDYIYKNLKVKDEAGIAS
jgi:hypothetical protein